MNQEHQQENAQALADDADVRAAFRVTPLDVAAVIRQYAPTSADLTVASLAGEWFLDLRTGPIVQAALAYGSDVEASRTAARAEITQQLIDLGAIGGPQRRLRVNVKLVSDDPEADYDGFQGLFEVEFDRDVSHLPLGQRAFLALTIHDGYTRIEGKSNFAIAVVDSSGYAIEPEETSVECEGSVSHLGDAITPHVVEVGFPPILAEMALAEGWSVFDCQGSANGPWQICRDDNADGVLLGSDDVAWKIVMDGVESHHAAARTFIRKHNPLEWAALCRWTGRGVEARAL